MPTPILVCSAARSTLGYSGRAVYSTLPYSTLSYATLLTLFYSTSNRALVYSSLYSALFCSALPCAVLLIFSTLVESEVECNLLYSGLESN
eukprot:3989561-Lingulodinium_polyedra.AAC.1